MWVLGLLACGGGEPPEISSVEPAREFLGEGTNVDVTVTVSDPNDDVVEITVVDGKTDLELAVADVTDQAGPHVVNVTWDDYVAVEPLDFEDTQLRRMQVTATDRRGNTSEVVVGEITLRCRGAGGTGVADRCYNVAVIGAAASQTCDDICETGDFDFRCNANAARDAFGTVGMVDFVIDDNGTKLPVTLDLNDCSTPASSVTFDTSQGASTINPGSQVSWTCYCLP